MKKISLVLIALCTTFCIITSCTKEGPMGPAGKDGTNGVDGTNGSNGSNGTDGRDGNANVYSSDWFEAGIWTVSVPNKHLYITKTEPKITAGVVDSGVVLVYANLVGSFTNRLLPVALYNGSYTNYWSFDFVAGSLKISVYSENVVTPATTNKFRYVIIPAGLMEASGYSKDILKTLPYNEIQRIFDIQ